MPERNSCSWNAMLAAWAQQGDANAFMQLFFQMMQEGMIGDRITCISAMSVCACHRALAEGKRLHASTVGTLHEKDTALQNALISYYAFAQIKTINTPKELFARMQLEGVLPDEFTFSSMLTTLSGESIASEVRYIHAVVIGAMNKLDVVLVTDIIKTYGNCGRIEDAQRMFDWVSKKDIAVWNVMIMAYSRDGNTRASFSLFCNMLAKDQTPNNSTFVALLSVCTNEAVLTEGDWLFLFIVSYNLEPELEIGNSLVNMYGRCGRLEDALEVFSRMSEHDLVSWSTLVIVFMQHDLTEEALHLFEQMLDNKLTPDDVIFLCILPVCGSAAALMQGRKVHHCIVCGHFDACESCQTALLNMYSECGSIIDAERMFDLLATRNIVSWNSLVAMCAHYGHAREAAMCFNGMIGQGLIPDAFTFYSILSACSHAGLLEEGLWCFIFMVQNYHIIPTVEHCNCMVDLYGRAGQLDTLELLLNGMGLQPSSVSWMTMLGACRVHSDMKRGQNAAEQPVVANSEDMIPSV